MVGSDLQSGSASFRVQALLPVAESFKFALELRTHTSGLAAPQMLFSNWEVRIQCSMLVDIQSIRNPLPVRLTTSYREAKLDSEHLWSYYQCRHYG